ncbi:MAG: MbcA/ParS/Xre antitoxin family protein [Beijerinckiaceae bacterium]
MRAANQLKIPNRALAQVIGISEASVSRIAQGKFQLEPASKPFELALLFIRMFRSLDAITGGDEATAAAWIRSENSALGAKPFDLMLHVPGLIDVIAYLDARRAVV